MEARNSMWPPGDPAIRPARPGEAGALTELVLRSKAHWGYGRDFMGRVRPLLTVTPAMIAKRPVVVLEDGALVAGLYALSDLDEGPAAGNGATAELDLLFVDPGHLGRGHGQRLFAHACDAARTAGAARLVVESDPNAVGFYERMGMARTGGRASPVEVGRVLPVLALDLA